MSTIPDTPCIANYDKNDNFGISSLKFNGLMYSDTSSKSEILNKQFQSVITKKSTTATPRLFGNKYPSIGNLSITLQVFFMGAPPEIGPNMVYVLGCTIQLIQFEKIGPFLS